MGRKREELTEWEKKQCNERKTWMRGRIQGTESSTLLKLSYKQLFLCLSFIFCLIHFRADPSNKTWSHFAVILLRLQWRKIEKQTDCENIRMHYDPNVTESNYLLISCHSCADSCYSVSARQKIMKPFPYTTVQVTPISWCKNKDTWNKICCWSFTLL